MSDNEVIQIRKEMPNPILELGGYAPVTGYWIEVIELTNAMLVAAALLSGERKFLRGTSNMIIREEIFVKSKPTAVDYAEFTMALNHMLWVLAQRNEKDNNKHTSAVCEVLDDLYYQWRETSLDTLKGDELSKYLTITD